MARMVCSEDWSIGTYILIFCVAYSLVTITGYALWNWWENR